MVVVVVCAIIGDSVGFEVGKRAGPQLLERRPLRGSAAVRQTMAMLEHYGGPAVFLGRFVAFARALIPGLAGMSGLRYRVFLFYNALGGTDLGGGLHPPRVTWSASPSSASSKRWACGPWPWWAGSWSPWSVSLIRRRRERRRLALEFADGPGRWATGRGSARGTGAEAD